MEKIQIIGMDELQNDEEKEAIETISGEYFDKIQRSLNEEISMSIHVKTYNKGGKQVQWEIKSKVTTSAKTFESSETDWDLPKVLHSVFSAIERQIERSLKKD